MRIEVDAGSSWRLRTRFLPNLWNLKVPARLAVPRTSAHRFFKNHGLARVNGDARRFPQVGQSGVFPYIVNLFVYESGSDSKRSRSCGKLRFFQQDQAVTRFFTRWKTPVCSLHGSWTKNFWSAARRLLHISSCGYSSACPQSSLFL